DKLGLSKPGVSKHLKELKSIEVVTERKEKTETGIENFYSLNHFVLTLIINPGGRSIIGFRSKGPFSPRLLLLEQVEEGEFKKDLKKFLEAVVRLDEEKRPEYIILFGSVARGEGTWKSDIDLCILHLIWDELDKSEMEELISQVVMKTKHAIKPHFLNLLEFESGKSMLNKEIKESGLVIYGDIYGRDELWRQMKRYKSIML
ncbi:MAG: nucleotidyltransferase domain-containing protein, partial [Thermoplasmata archaeon]|nr:nucleotidyltransferase domain-containing protein [Thermoplasmata archaeon]